MYLDLKCILNPWAFKTGAFKTGAFNRSAISPLVSVYFTNWNFSTQKTHSKFIYFA